jgi:hypothetical protein
MLVGTLFTGPPPDRAASCRAIRHSSTVPPCLLAGGRLGGDARGLGWQSSLKRLEVDSRPGGQLHAGLLPSLVAGSDPVVGGTGTRPRVGSTAMARSGRTPNRTVLVPTSSGSIWR